MSESLPNTPSERIDALSPAPVTHHPWMPNLAQMGMIGWIASLAVFFVALILAFAITLSGAKFNGPVQVPIALWISTLLICLSGFSLAIGRYYLRRAKVRTYGFLLSLTTILAIAFVVSQGLGTWWLFQQGVFAASNSPVANTRGSEIGRAHV